MKKILLFLLLFIFSNNIFAQLDTEHWFAPMVDRSAQTNPNQSIYMSTNEVIPFRVDVYSNNVVIGSVMISKNNPGKYNIGDSGSINREQIITKSQSDLFKPVGKGIYLKAEKSFFASLRFSVTQHAEILTSKGSAGLGKDFRIVMAPIQVKNGILNFMTSVMATKDNTTVTISGFDAGLKFSDNVSRTSFTFTLNRGQSYIIDGSGSYSENSKGLIGARVTANNDVTITNGNFNGQYAGNYGSASDILMDQGVPVNKLGKEFVLVKGNGANSFLNTEGDKTTMEKAIIVAVEDNTQVYLNGSNSPAIVLQTGEYYETPPDSYIAQASSHYNMYISTNNKNIYVYQLLAGIEKGDPPYNSNGEATGGFNYIPPLSCYLPFKIDEIGLIDENRVYITNSGYKDKIPTKFNIITERGAVVDVKSNGASLSLDASNGPFDVTGNNNWVTYSIPNITGNVSINSSKAVTAGISAGDSAVGYGGYFAGFSPILELKRSLNSCLPDSILDVGEGYDHYKWMFRDEEGNESVVKDVNGTDPDANILKPTQIGYYWAIVQQGSCDPVITPVMEVLNCDGYTPMSYDVCDILLPTPVKFSLSKQGVKSIEPVTDPDNPSNPSKGQLIIDNVAKTISYVPNPGVTGEDSFWYKIIGDDPLSSDEEEFRVKVNINNIWANDTIVKACKVDNVQGEFDLSKVNTDASLTQVFYKNKTDADGDTGLDTIPNSDLANYKSAEGFVYLRLDNGHCKKTIAIELKFYPKAELSSNIYTGCDVDFKGVMVDFDQVKADLLIDYAYFPNVNFYLAGVKLGNGWRYSADTVVQMEVISPDGCATEMFNITFKVGGKLPLITTNATDKFCDPELDDSHTINLNNYNHLFLNTADMSIQPKFYNSLLEAQEDRNALGSGDVNLVGLGTKTFHYRFDDGVRCPNVGTLTLDYTKGFASTTLPVTPKIICEGSTTVIDAGDKHKKWEWFDENDLSKVFPKTRTQTLGPGKYYVILTSPNDCEYKQSFEIIGSPKAVLDISKFNATRCDDNFDGKIDVKLLTEVTPLILQNPHPDIKVEYYSDAAMSATQKLGDNFSYSADNTRIYVKAVSTYCSETIGFIDFKVGNKISVISTNQTVEECDDDLDGKFTVNLDKYKSSFTNDTNATLKFFVNKTDAQNPLATNAIDEFEVNNQKTFYVRISSTTAADCPELAELTIKIKLPKKSDTLQDETICSGATIDLDADSDGSLGAGFTYEWFKESDPSTPIGSGQKIKDLEVGKYFVIITAPNGCPYKQNVEIKSAELPTIEGMEISGSTVRIIAKGGTKPYKYAISTNGFISNYQDSDTFTNVSPGLHKAYVISADNCEPVEKEFSVIEIYNLISPNGDGVNDVLDMSLLKYKFNVKFQVLDRTGKKLFEGNTNNNFIWDGKENGKTLPTSSYWYIIEWQDFENSPPVKYTGWILLKNRNSD